LYYGAYVAENLLVFPFTTGKEVNFKVLLVASGLLSAYQPAAGKSQTSIEANLALVLGLNWYPWKNVQLYISAGPLVGPFPYLEKDPNMMMASDSPWKWACKTTSVFVTGSKACARFASDCLAVTHESRDSLWTN